MKHMIYPLFILRSSKELPLKSKLSLKKKKRRKNYFIIFYFMLQSKVPINLFFFSLNLPDRSVGLYNSKKIIHLCGNKIGKPVARAVRIST